MRWQRTVRWALVALLLVTVAAIYFGLRRRTVEEESSRAAQTDQRAVQESAAGDIGQWLNERFDAKVKFQRLLTYPDGSRRFFKIDADVPGRAGRSFNIRADEADVGKDQSNLALRGHVVVTSSDGAIVEGEKGSFSQGEGIMRMDGPVRFSRGRLSGTGIGMTYDQAREVLWILDQADVTVVPDETGGERLHMVAAAAGFAEADHYIRLEGRPDRRVHIEHGAQTLDAENMVAYLTPDGDQLQSLELRNDSRIGGDTPEPGGLESMTGRDINLTYAEDGRTLQRAVIAGSGVVRIAGVKRGAGKKLAAEWLDLGIAADGKTLASLSGRDHVVLELPAEGDNPARTISSGAIDGQETAAGQGITSATFQEQVEFREANRSGSGRVARSQSMTVMTKAGFGDLESARFFGGVEFEEDALKARAREGRYDVAKGTLNLAGNDERTGARPEIVDEQATITAVRLDVLLDTRQVNAWGSVNTLMRPAPDGQGRGGARRASGESRLFSADEPTNAMSDNMTYAGQAHRALYVGHARLWQGTTTVEADKVAVDDETGELVATGSARTSMPVTQVNEKTKAKEQVLSRGSGGAFEYKDKERKAVYRKDDTKPARLLGPEGDLQAATIEIYFKAEANEVERMEAYEAVELKLADGRVATSSRLTYFAADERYVMGGDPVKVVDACDTETTGKSLTFFKSVDRIIVDGNEERRTQTKGGAKCPGAGNKKGPLAPGSGPGE